MKLKNMQIQSIRGAFCLMIMLFHYTCRYSNIYGRNEFFVTAFKYFTFVALMGFLCLNGYFLDGKKNDSGLSFFWSKIKRLYPGYFAAITIIFLLQLTGYLGEERSVTFRQYLLNIPFLNAVTRTGFVDGAHWYVVFLLLIYFIYSFLRKLRGYYKEEFVIVNVSLMLIGLIVSHILHKQNSGLMNYLNYYFSFFAGVVMRRWQTGNLNKKSFILTVTLMSGYMLCSRSAVLSLITIVTLIVMYLAFAERLSLLEHIKLLQYLGDRSYIVYLLHQSVGFMTINFMISIGVQNVAMIVIVAMVIGIGLSFVLFEVLTKLKIKC